MIILKEHNSTGWITCIISGRWVKAKVYDVGSPFGINNGRVNKLTIGKTSGRDKYKPFFDQMDYNYDRGLDFDNLSEGVLNAIVSELEALPKNS